MAAAYQFGVEIELLLGLRDPQNDTKDLEAFMDVLAKEYNREKGPSYRRMRADVGGQDQGAEDFLEWSLTDDVTINAEAPGHWPIEIVSPIMRSDDGTWRSHVAEVWRIMTIICLIRTDESCGTHVHISPPERQEWDVETLKKVCYSILHFEDAFEVLLPLERRGNQWSKSNRVDNPKFEGKQLGECFRLIDQCLNNGEIVRLMNNDGDRYYGWNFMNLVFGGKMTIEFRRGPGITRVEECLSWVEFTISFVRATDEFGSRENLAKFGTDVKGLWRFIGGGRAEAGGEPGALNSIFQGKSGRLSPTRVGRLSAKSRAKGDQKKIQDENKNLMVKKVQGRIGKGVS